MVISIFMKFPFIYYSVLPDSTLTTKIREESWKLDDLFPQLKKTKSEIDELIKSIKLNKGNALKLKSIMGLLTPKIKVLADEIRTGFKDLKLANFYDSSIFYINHRLLHHVFKLCKKEHNRLIIERKIESSEKIMRGFGIAEKELIKFDAEIVNILRKLRWKAEKRVQHEFSFVELTLRSMENLNRKIKIEAIKVKNAIPQKTFLMKKIEKQGKINPEDVVALAKLVSGAIDRIGKDVSYSSKLIKKFENEMSALKRKVERLKNSINNIAKNKVNEETQKKLKEAFNSWDNAISSLDEEVNKDLMQIFRNIFVEYKYVGTRQLKAA